jgi:hypothetical protein
MSVGHPVDSQTGRSESVQNDAIVGLLRLLARDVLRRLKAERVRSSPRPTSKESGR